MLKELNAEPIDDVKLDHDLEDTPSKDNKELARADDEQLNRDKMEMNDLDNTPIKDSNNDEPIANEMERSLLHMVLLMARNTQSP